MKLTELLATQGVPGLLICLSTLGFLVLERRRPGRALPEVPGWHRRARAVSLLQLGLIALGGLTWNHFFRARSRLRVGSWHTAATEGLAYWFGGTFLFYWWHRLRHANGFWLVFHQLHHSPARIEVATSFYKHPVEIVADSVIASFFIFGVLGGAAEAAAWTSFFGAPGEYFYHANIATPR